MSNYTWSQNLDKHQWKERVIYIVADKENHALLEQQFDLLNRDKQGLVDRNIVVYKCLEGKYTFYNWNDKPKINTASNISEGFKIVLVGLDGGEKYSSNTIVESDVIFNLIDAMPMRRQELEARKKND